MAETHLRIGESACPSFYSNIIQGYIKNEYLTQKRKLTVVVNYYDYINSERTSGFLSEVLIRDSKDYLDAYNYLNSFVIGDAYRDSTIHIENNKKVFRWFLYDTVLVMSKLVSVDSDHPIDFEITVPEIVTDGQGTEKLTFNNEEDLALSKSYPIVKMENFSPLNFKEKVITVSGFREEFMKEFSSAFGDNLDSSVLEEELVQYMIDNEDRRSRVIAKVFTYAYVYLNNLNFILDVVDKEVLEDED